MSDKPFRWRTVVEVGVISAIIYVLLGAPGLKSSPQAQTLRKTEIEPPLAQAKAESLVYPDVFNLKCPEHKYNIHVFSATPLVVYIDGFLSEEEADHLVDISSGKWQRSTVFSGGHEETDEKIRKSEKALIDRDNTVQCIEQRALAVQGWPQDTFIERLWTQRYNVTGHYSYHYDWSTANKDSMRISTFMVYLQTDCEGGGTHFPRIEIPYDKRWCDFIDCSQDDNLEGVTFRARKGAAIFWRNFDEEGRGYRELIHAGMPVTKGTKVGLNIWSWYQKGHMAKM